MVVRSEATLWPGAKKDGPREIESSAATLRPDERKLDAVAVKDTEQGGGLQTEAAEPRGIWPEERALDLDSVLVEGWVAGVPVVNGEADSGWRECEGGRVRVVVRVQECPEQKEWVRGMAHGGAYAREVLG